MEYDKILITHSREGVKAVQSCPFIRNTKCIIKGIECRYGLTEVIVPKDCPIQGVNYKESISATVQRFNDNTD